MALNVIKNDISSMLWLPGQAHVAPSGRHYMVNLVPNRPTAQQPTHTTTQSITWLGAATQGEFVLARFQYRKVNI